jgi:hypothetical protein
MGNYTTVQVRQEVSLDQLQHVFWDALVCKLDGDVECAARAVLKALRFHTEPKQVKASVREWLGWYGTRCVECGPENDYPTDQVESMVKMLVARAYRLTY